MALGGVVGFGVGIHGERTVVQGNGLGIDALVVFAVAVLVGNSPCEHVLALAKVRNGGVEVGGGAD
jgi:hypothetical protein